MVTLAFFLFESWEKSNFMSTLWVSFLFKICKLNSVSACGHSSMSGPAQSWIRTKMQNSVWDPLQDHLWDGLRAQVLHLLREGVWDGLRDKLWDRLQGKVLHRLPVRLWKDLQASDFLSTTLDLGLEVGDWGLKISILVGSIRSSRSHNVRLEILHLTNTILHKFLNVTILLQDWV